jgi:hypothetical protein
MVDIYTAAAILVIHRHNVILRKHETEYASRVTKYVMYVRLLILSATSIAWIGETAMDVDDYRE